MRIRVRGDRDKQWLASRGGTLQMRGIRSLFTVLCMIGILMALVPDLPLQARERENKKGRNSGDRPSSTIFSAGEKNDIRDARKRAQRFRELNRGLKPRNNKNRAKMRKGRSNKPFPDLKKQRKRIAKKQRSRISKNKRRANKRSVRSKHPRGRGSRFKGWSHGWGPWFGPKPHKSFSHRAKRRAWLKKKRRRLRARRHRARARAMERLRQRAHGPRVERHYHYQEPSGPSLGEILYGINTAIHLFNQFAPRSGGYGYNYYDYAP
jgi:hypothetical protein